MKAEVSTVGIIGGAPHIVDVLNSKKIALVINKRCQKKIPRPQF